MIVRKATFDDTAEIIRIIEKARTLMRNEGNYFQWINGYPSKQLINEDIKKEQFFIWEDEKDKNIHGAFAFIIGKDPTYEIIEKGQWPNNKPYGTIHRIGSDGEKRGMLKDCLNYCLTYIDEVRLDTHEDNISMTNACQKAGFKRCGVIYIADGSPRVAYQYSSGK